MDAENIKKVMPDHKSFCAYTLAVDRLADASMRAQTGMEELAQYSQGVALGLTLCTDLGTLFHPEAFTCTPRRLVELDRSDELIPHNEDVDTYRRSMGW